MNRNLIAALVGSCAVLAAACSSPSDDAAAPTITKDPRPTVMSASTARPAAPTTSAVNCDPAPDQYVVAINAAFSNSAETLADVFAVSAPGGLIYVGGNIMQGTTKVSSADVWVARGASMFALSGDARKRTQLPDGRKLLNANAGDGYGTVVQGCVTAAERNRNQSGGR